MLKKELTQQIESAPTPMSSHSSKGAIYAALCGTSAIAVTKFAAAIFTGSSAMWSEDVHSLVDTGNQVFLLMGIKRSQKPPTDSHPFGHGKEVYFWAFVVAILIFSLGAEISFYEGWHRIHNPQPLTNVYIVLSLAIVFEGISRALRTGNFKKPKAISFFGQRSSTAKTPPPLWF